MPAWELFNLIWNSKYRTSGNDVNWTLQIVDYKWYLLFQGSNSRRDWEVNLAFPRKVYKKQENPLIVHGGYAHAWKTCNDEIMKAVENIKDLTIAGHSYGGAMAALAAEDFYYRFGRKAKVVTFGAPKLAGTKKTAAYLRTCGDFTQYIINNDIVPVLPPFPGFKQITLVKIGEPFNFFKIFDGDKYHCGYGDKKQYD